MMTKFSSRQITAIVVSVCSVLCVFGVLACLVVVHGGGGEGGGGAVGLVRTGEPRALGGDVGSDPIAELDGLIGQEAVKKEVHTLVSLVRVRKMREEQGLKTAKMTYNIVFTGNPGTGKTTVARLVAQVYRDLGLLGRGHLVETDGMGLIGSDPGETARKVNQLCDSAMGGVLFIDEAYALTQGGGGGRGDEAVTALIKRMEDDRDSLVVIVAGYADEMRRFLDSNPGLASRFKRHIDFPDYTPDELTRIFEIYVTRNEYTITPEALGIVSAKMEEAVAHKGKSFGNARFVRNVFEDAVLRHADRLASQGSATAQDLSELTSADIVAAFE